MLQNRYDYRKNQSFSRLIKLAEFRYNAYMEKIDYTLKRNLDRNQLERLAFWNFVKEGQNLFITGSSGTWKSYIAFSIFSFYRMFFDALLINKKCPLLNLNPTERKNRFFVRCRKNYSFDLQ